MINRIILNGTSYFGSGSRSILSNEIKSRNLKKAFVVSDSNLVKAGITDKVLTILKDAGIEYELFSDIKPNPTVNSVKEGVQKCKMSNSDCIVAVGGGSSIDVSKAIGIIMTNPEHADVVSLDGAVNTKNPAMPIFALPTTAGTAAEVTINYVITDEERVKKMVCVDSHDIPVVAIIDAELMAGMPKSVAASTGMDALTHAIEGYITKAAWEMTDMFHLKAIELIYNNLEKAVNDKDMEAINNMGVAQYIAGMGFSNVGLGIVHSMAHSLGAVYDTPHGLANALLLPYVMEYNGEVAYKKYYQIGKVLGIDNLDLTKEEIIEKVVEKVRNLAINVGIPQKLHEINVKEEDLEMLAEKSFNDVCTGGNPRETSVEDILEIYKKAF